MKYEESEITNIEVGKRITTAREEAGLTKKELALKIQVSPSTIGRYEEGIIEKLKMPVIKSIAIALNVDPMWLVGRSETMKIEDTVGVAFQGNNSNNTINNTSNIYNGLSEQEQDLLRIFRSVSPKGQVHILNTVYETEKKYSKKGG